MKFLIAIFVVLLGAGALWWGAQKGQDVVQVSKFDKTSWSDEDKIYDTPHLRVAMVEALMNDHLSKGMSRAAVEDIIGAPTDTPYFADHDMVYWLGDEKSGFGIDSLWLVLDLDANGLVNDIQLLTD